MKKIALTVVAVAVLSCPARAGDKAGKLVGKWEMTKGDVVGLTAEFSKDGKLKVSVTRGGKTETKEGTYKLDGDTLKITSKRGDMDRTESFKVKKLADNELVLEDKGKEVVFKKTK